MNSYQHGHSHFAYPRDRCHGSRLRRDRHLKTLSPAIDSFVVQRRRFRVLIVDDEAPVRRAIRRVLGSTHFVFSEAGNPDEALSRLSQRMQPDVVVLDLSLVDKTDGLSVLQAMDGRKLTASAIVFSGYVDVPRTVMAMRGGAVDVITKDGDFSSLRDAVRLSLEKIIASNQADATLVSGSEPQYYGGEETDIGASAPLTFRQEMDRTKRTKLAELLEKANGNFSEAARIAEMDPANLRRMATRLGLQLTKFGVSRRNPAHK